MKITAFIVYTMAVLLVGSSAEEQKLRGGARELCDPLLDCSGGGGNPLVQECNENEKELGVASAGGWFSEMKFEVKDVCNDKVILDRDFSRSGYAEQICVPDNTKYALSVRFRGRRDGNLHLTYPGQGRVYLQKDMATKSAYHEFGDTTAC